MAFEERTDTLTCAACDTMHSARWHRLPVREWQRIACQVCGGIMVEGNSIRDYVQVRALAG